MKIKNLSCRQFAGLRDSAVSFADGINVVYGKNESGKSTLVNLLSRTLFQDSRVKGNSTQVKEFKDLYYPANRRGKSAVNLYPDGKVSFETAEGVYTLEKEWGDDDPRCRLTTPDDDLIKKEDDIKVIMKEVLRYGEGVYSDFLFSPQSNAAASLQALLEAQKKENSQADAKRELSETLTKAFAEGDGISTSKIEEEINKKISSIEGKHWDTERGCPKKGNDRWKKDLGDILTAYYACEDAQNALDKLHLLEDAAQKANTTFTDAEESAQRAKAACERFAEVERLLEDHERVAHELVRLQGEEAKLADVLRDWPMQVGLLEKAERLYAENENRAILTRLQKAREILGELEGIDKSDLDRPCPTKEDIASAKEAQREIMKLENKFCGMNLSAAVEMLGGYGLTVTSLRTGETVCADSGQLAITEAVKLVIPGVMELQLAPADVDATAIEKEIGVQKDIVDGILAVYQQESIDGLEMLAERIQQARSTEKSVDDRLKMHLAGESLQELEARASAIITPVRDEETIAADIHAMCGKESIAAFIGGKNATVEGYVKEYSSTETLAAAVDSKAKERRETETRMAEMPEIPEEYLHVTEPKAYLEKLKRSEEIADAECKDALKEKTAAERDLDNYQGEMDGEDLLENCERAQRELEEQKALLKHWFHIRDVFEEQKAQLRGNPMEDITKHFARYLGLISGGKVSPEFPQTDKLDMNIYSGDRLVSYRRLSEGTKETVYLAFRLAVLDHLFPNGGGVIVLDDPLTDMDEERVEQSCVLIRDCAERHQVIFLTCREAYLPLLNGNVIRV